MGSPRVSTLVARGRAAAMEEESFFVSADEAEEGEAAHRDARRVGHGKGDGARRAETGRGDDDAFEDASDAADDAFEDPIDTSNAPAASSGGEFVSGTDTDGGGHRRAPPRARAALPGVATSRVTRGSRVDDVEDDASLARRGGDVAVDVDGVGSTALLSPPSANDAIRSGRAAPTSGDARRHAALAFASAAAGSETDSRDGGFASAGDAATEPEDEPLATDALARRRAAVTSMTPDAPTDDSFADAGALDESTVVDDDDKASLSGQKINVVKSGVSPETPTRPRLDLARPPPLAPPLTPPSPLAPGSSRARSCPTRSDGRKDLTSPATAFRRRKSAAGFDEKAPDSNSPLGASWGDENDSAPRSARSSRAEALLRDARRGSSDDASESSLQERPRSRALAEEGSGGFQNESRRFSRNHFGSASASSVASSPPRGGPGSPFAEEDASARRASRRRVQREKYMAKLRDGFAEDAWMSPEEARRRAATARRNAHSEPEALFRRFDGFGARRGSSASDDAFSFASRATRASATYERGSTTGGERRGSSRFTARAAAAEEAARARFSRSETPGTGTGTRATHPPRSPPGFGPVPPHAVGVGPDPEAMLWQLQQQQQMVFQQMQQLQLAQQQQQRRAHAGYLHDSRVNSRESSASANGFGADDGSRPPPNAFDLVRRNAVEEVTRLVETRLVSVHQLDADGNSLLMWACARGHRRLTKFLLKRGAAVNGRNAVGDTPLHFCLAGGHGELGAYLVAKGADEAAANDRGATPYEGMV